MLVIVSRLAETQQRTIKYETGLIALITGRNEVVAKVMFLQVSVILSTGGVSGESPPDQADTPPGPRRTPPDQGEPPRPRRTPPGPRRTPPGPRRTPPDQGDPPGGRLQHTVNERPVRILLECNLVHQLSLKTKISSKLFDQQSDHLRPINQYV